MPRGAAYATKSASDARSITIAVIGLPRVSNHDDLDPFRRAGCRIRVVTNPNELTSAHIVIIPGSKSTIADLRWMKSRGLDTAITEAANRGTTIVGICGGYQLLGQHLDDPDATESPEPQSEPGLGLLPVSTVFDTTKTTRRVTVEIPEHTSGPLTGAAATGTGYEIHTGITTATETPLATLTDDSISKTHPTRDGVAPNPLSFLGRELEGGLNRQQGKSSGSGLKPNAKASTWPDGTSTANPPVIGTYVHGLFDSPDILRRLLNTTADNHNLPRPVIQDFSMEAEYDRLARVVREAIDMDLIETLVK